MTFTFTMDAFPEYTNFNKSKKVLCAIQVIEDATSGVATNESVMAGDNYTGIIKDNLEITN